MRMAAQPLNDVEYQILSHTEAKKIKLSHKWVIRDFRSTFYHTYELTSGPFMYSQHGICGYLSLGRDWEDDPYLSNLYEELPTATLTINLTIDGEGVAVGIETFALNSNDQKTKILKKMIDFKKNNEIEFAPFLSRKEVHSWKEDEIDTVTIFCDITITTKIYVMIHQQPAQVPSIDYNLISDIKNLFNDSKHSDVTITVGSKVFHAHKLILSARSSVFRGMFQHNMKENEEDNVDITDISEEVVEELLKFIYADRTEKIGEMTLELMDAAEKYDLKNLKIQCGQNLHNNLHSGNAVEKLILADRYDAEEAKNSILKFISFHMKEVLDTKEYSIMKESHPHLVIEILEAITKFS